MVVSEFTADDVLQEDTEVLPNAHYSFAIVG